MKPLTITAIVLAVAVVVIPVAFYFLAPRPQPPEEFDLILGGSHFDPSPLKFEKQTIGPEPEGRPRICNVQVLDFDGDGRNDVLACDGLANQVIVYFGEEGGRFREQVIGDDIIVPAHATVVDLDGDGDRDVVVAQLGDIRPNDEVIGKVVLLERDGESFTKRTLLNDVRRVADVRAGDLNGDGAMDLVVAVFGYARGEVLWLENKGDLKFLDRRLYFGPGVIHTPIADFDGDGDLDIAAIASQEDEELWAFENLGNGEFKSRMLWFTFNYDIGSAGLVAADIDADGDVDLILPVGDNLEAPSYPQPYHGCLLMENKGNWNFEERRIASFGGTYAADVGDFDGDGDLDVALVSMFNDWAREENASVVWLENNGGEFTPWQIDNAPTHLVTVGCGDLDGDGRDDIVAGNLHLVGPLDRRGRITAWMSRP